MGIHIGLELLKGAVQQGDICLRGVMLILHAGAADNSALGQLFEDGFGDLDLLTQSALQIFQRDMAGAEQGGLFAYHRDHGALHTHIALAAIQDQG